MRLIACVLLAVASATPEADPALVYAGGFPYYGYSGLGYGLGYGYGLGLGAATYTYATPTVEAVASVGATPVAVGGYKAVAGDNGGLKGAVHEVPGLVGAPLLATQESAGDVSLTTGTGVYAIGHKLNTVSVPVVHALGKRSAEAEPEADPYLLYGGLGGYGLGYGLGYGYGGYGLGYSRLYTGLGLGYHGYGLGYGYYANSGGAVHAVGKRSADAEPEADPEADPYFYYGYGHGYGYRHYGYGHHGYSGYYGHAYRYPYYGYYGYYG